MTEAVLVTTLIAAALLLVFGLLGGMMKCQYAGVTGEFAGERGEPQACINAKQQNLVADAAASLPSGGDDTSFFGRAALGLASGFKNQAGGFIEILSDPFGFAGDLVTLGKALVTDPVAVFDALVEELGGDVETLLSGDPFRTAELIGENLSPLQLARVAKRLADFAGSGKIGKRGTRCASFIAGTPIWIGDGLQSIELLSGGDPVRARSDDTYDDSVRPVVQTLDRKTKRHLLVTIGNERIGVTGEHPFWVQGRGWTPAAELQVGTPLATATGEALVWSVETVESPAKVFNLTVAWDHSYFAGASGVWVHNANSDCRIGTPAKLDESIAKYARLAEQRTAKRLADDFPEFDGRTFEAPKPPDPGYDWTDDLGRTFDALGDGTKSEFFRLDQFTRSIDKHLLKGNDFTIIDMTGYKADQIAAVRTYVDALPADKQALIRRVGF